MVELCSRFYYLVFICVLIDMLNGGTVTAHIHTLLSLIKLIFPVESFVSMHTLRALFLVRSIEFNLGMDAVLQSHYRTYVFRMFVTR